MKEKTIEDLKYIQERKAVQKAIKIAKKEIKKPEVLAVFKRLKDK
ncbi:hypothetical protein [Campylobacter peloridis]|nr:hypothetical protein [Campylobacter peloridis]